MNSVLRSVKPYWFYLICEGIKKVEVGKSVSRSEEWDNTVYLYCSKDMRSFNRIPEEHREKYRKYLGTVGAKFVCDKVKKYASYKIYDLLVPQEIDICKVWDKEMTGLTYNELCDYGKGKPLYGWHISDLKIYDTPRELGEFKTPDKPYHRIIERDGSLMFMDGYESGKPITRAPQSWQFIQEG